MERVPERAREEEEQRRAAEEQQRQAAEEVEYHDDSSGASEHTDKKQEDSCEENIWNDGKTLALTASLLPKFGTRKGGRNCLDIPMPPADFLNLSDADRDVLRNAADAFFWTFPKRTGAGEHGAERLARRMKTEGEIVASWTELFERRRAEQPDDTQAADVDQVGDIWSDWCHDWINSELFPYQQAKPFREKSSFFNAWVKKTYGSKHILLALLETGLTWAPPPDMVEGDFDSASKHVAKNFVIWLQQLTQAVKKHKENPHTVAARARSGDTYKQSGLTDAQMQVRQARNRARDNLSWAQRLERRLIASKGGGKGTSGATEHDVNPLPWDSMSRNDRWWLTDLWNGNFQSELDRAQEAHGGTVQAKPFRLA